MKIRDLCKCMSDEDTVWQVYVPNEEYTDGESDEQYDVLTSETLNGIINVFGEREIDENHKGIYFGRYSGNNHWVEVAFYLKPTNLPTTSVAIGVSNHAEF